MKKALFLVFALMLLVAPQALAGDLNGEYTWGGGLDVVLYDGKEATFLEEVTAEYRYNPTLDENSIYFVAKIDAYNLVKGIM